MSTPNVTRHSSPVPMAIKQQPNEDGNTSDNTSAPRNPRSRSRNTPLDPVEEWQRLFHAAERRKVQNRNAQRRYRQSLKKRLESLELHGAHLGAQPSAPSSVSSRSSTFDIDTRGRSVSNCSVTTIASLAEPHQDENVIPDASHAHRRHWSTPCLPGAPSTAPMMMGGDMGITLPPFDQSVLDMSQQQLLTPPTHPDGVMEPVNMEMPPTSDMGFNPYQHPSNMTLGVGELSSTPPQMPQDGFFIPPPSMPYAASPPRGPMLSLGQPDTPPKSPFLHPTGANPLHLAAMRGSVPILKMLLERGADVNEADERGCTALHYAVEHSQEEAVSMLLSHGADLTAKIR